MLSGDYWVSTTSLRMHLRPYNAGGGDVPLKWVFLMFLLTDYSNAGSCSMFPENLTFAGTRHRTTRLNEAIRVFSSMKADFE